MSSSFIDTVMCLVPNCENLILCLLKVVNLSALIGQVGQRVFEGAKNMLTKPQIQNHEPNEVAVK